MLKHYLLGFKRYSVPLHNHLLLFCFVPFHLLLSIYQVFGSTQFQSVLAPGRPPYFQCPLLEEDIISTYPLLTNPQCSITFTYCATQVAIPGKCPWGLFFNPRILSCDAPVPESCWVDESEVIQPRPIVDEPNYNDCGRRPCNFFPNGEDDDDGRTFVFCQFGKPNVRECPKGTSFCTLVKDCIPSAEAHVFAPVEISEGKREAENPIPSIDEISPADSMGTDLANRGKVNPLGIMEPNNDIIIIQAPGEHIDVPDSAHWSPWYLCPEGLYITMLDPKWVTCMPIGPGRDPERKKKSQVVHLTRKKRVYFPVSNCDKGRGGVMISFKINKSSKLVEFYCSNDHPPQNAEWCPATTAMCGISFQHGREKDISNVRAKCCPVEEPTFSPQEKLKFIDILDNYKGTEPKTVEFNSTCGIDIPTGADDKTMRLYYVSLGFTIDHVWDEIQRDLKGKTKCEGKCYYPWNNYVVKNRVGRHVTGSITVPPGVKLNLYQVYAKAGYFTIYTNMFVRKIEKNGKEVEDQIWEGIRPEKKEASIMPVPVLAVNISLDEVQAITKKANQQAGGLCKFLNLTASPNHHWEDKIVATIKNPEGKGDGKWATFQNCSRKHFIENMKLGKSGGVVQIHMGCRPLEPKKLPELPNLSGKKAKRSVKDPMEKEKKKAEKMARKELEKAEGKVTHLEFLKPGGGKVALGESDKSDCDKGVAIGFQVKSGGGVTEDLRLVCSCPKDGKAASEKGGGWSEAHVCEPLHAISGFVPRFSDKGLADFKVRCERIPAVAAKCKPKYSKKLVATCKTGPDQNSCIFKAPVGVSYSFDKLKSMDTANFMESIGHSLNCAFHPLSRNFRHKFKDHDQWKDSFYHPVSTVTGQIFDVPSSATSDIHQYVGRCGPYVVYSSRFVRKTAGVGEENAEDVFEVPLSPGNEAPPCWSHGLKKKSIHDTARKKLPPTKLIAIEQIRRNRSHYIQRPPKIKVSDDTIWSPWMVCNNTAPNHFTHVAEVRVDGILCQVIMGPGEIPAVNKFLTHNITGLSLSAKDCNKVGGGAIVGFKKVEGKPTEYYCSPTRPKPTPNEEWCPPMTAMCGVSIQYSPTLLKVENLRIKCCHLTGPRWDIAKEGLALIATFDNSNRNVWRKFRFDTGIEGAVVLDEYKVLANYWFNLGYTWDKSWEKVEDAIIYNATCYIPEDKDCLYPWSEYQFTSKDLFQVAKKIMVPPNSLLKLYQIFMQVSFYRIYVNRFIELIHDKERDAMYEEIRDIPLEQEDKDSMLGEDTSGGRAKWSAPPPLLAINVTAMDYEKKLPKLFCTYHNLSGMPEKDEAEMKEDGWKKCGSKAVQLNKIKFVRGEGHEGKKKPGPIIDLETGCRDVKKLTRNGTYFEAEDDDDPNVLEDSDVEIRRGRKYVEGECQNGLMVGYQKVAESYEILCSCKEEDEEREIYALSDKKMCKPFQALNGVKPSYSDFSGFAKQKTLAGLRKFCVDVPNIAKECKPRYIKKKIVAAKCKNDDEVARDCALKLNIGVTYNLDTENNIQIGNTLESVGYTIPCVAKTLAKNFQDTLKDAVWREPFWFYLSEINAKMTNIQENSETNIYQVVGRCGPYVVHTNRFLEDPEGDDEPDEELDLPLYELPDMEMCWQDPLYKPRDKPDESSILDM